MSHERTAYVWFKAKQTMLEDGIQGWNEWSGLEVAQNNFNPILNVRLDQVRLTYTPTFVIKFVYFCLKFRFNSPVSKNWYQRNLTCDH